MALKLKKFDSINVIPFIDVMLVLLTIVLTVATFVAQGIIPVNLPKGLQTAAAQVKTHEISIKADGALYYSTELIDKAKLIEILNNVSTSDTMIVRSDKDARFQNFVDVMDALKTKGFEKVSIITVVSQ